MESKKIIEFIDYSFQYFSQAEPTLNNINLTLYEGEKILIVGPSGSGKSTLGHCLNGLIPGSYKGKVTGKLLIKGNEAKKQSIFKLSKDVGTVLQDSDGQFVGLTVGEDIAFSMENDGIRSEEMKRRVREVAKMVDMENLLASSPFELSGGQKQRTSLAGVLVDQVDILLFDEPLANLDPATGKAAIEIIDSIHQETKKTVIIIEHRLEDVLHREVDRIILMNEGRIICDLHPHEMVSSSVLTDHGIREPLYVTALKYANVPISPSLKPAYIEALDYNKVKDYVTSWNQTLQDEDHEPKTPVVLSGENLSFTYNGDRLVLNKVNFSIHEGEMVAIVGKNGAGKTTLSKLLCGFEKEDEGIIRYQGKDIKDLSIKERAEIIGLVMQNPNQMLSKHMIYDEVALGLRLRQVPEDEIQVRVKKVLEVCGLEPFIDWPISVLSYGQKKRVSIAAILVLEPKILILDEPTAGQDYKHYAEMMAFIEDINKTGVTVIMITHDMHLMLEYTGRAIVLSDGIKIADTSAAKVLTDPDVIEKANLKETSLFTLAKAIGIQDPTSFIQHFIDFERREVRHQ